MKPQPEIGDIQLSGEDNKLRVQPEPQSPTRVEGSS
jgi:hypothetical protein